jgi:curli biogenesis system outer membrane secretion channel CsgG
MKIINVSWALVLSFLVVAGCSESSWNDTMTGSRVVAQPQQPIQYVGPKATVVVGNITNSTGAGTEIAATGTTIQTGSAAVPPDKVTTIRDPIGSGMRDQLITSLTQTGAFTVLRDSTGASPQYLIEGAVTEYEPSQASVAGGYGWGIPTRRRRPLRISDPTVSAGNVFSQILAPNAIGGMFQQDHIAMNIHIVDCGTNAIIASTTVEATPKDLGVATNLLFGRGSRIADVGGQMKTPMQKAIRACMAKAAVWAANTVASQQ